MTTVKGCFVSRLSKGYRNNNIHLLSVKMLAATRIDCIIEPCPVFPIVCVLADRAEGLSRNYTLTDGFIRRTPQ